LPPPATELSKPSMMMDNEAINDQREPVDVSEYALEKVSSIPRRNAGITAKKDETHLFVSLHGLPETEKCSYSSASLALMRIAYQSVLITSP
jgi:hypothetical protein